MKIQNTNFIKPLANFEGMLNNKPKVCQSPIQVPTQLPNIQAVNSSLFNTNIPVGYMKLYDIKIPNTDLTASFYQLSNGQKVVIVPKEGKTKIETVFNVGSLNETPELSGISHCIEHSLFNGSTNLKPKEFENKCAQLSTAINASTNYTQTKYYSQFQNFNQDTFEQNLKLHCELIQHPIFSAEYLEKEKGPIKSEIDNGIDDDYQQLLYNSLSNLLNLPQEQTNISGSKDTVNSLTRQKLLDYYNTWYNPDNSTMYITGEVNPEEVIQLVSKYSNKQNDYSKINQRLYKEFSPIQTTTRKDYIAQQETEARAIISFFVPKNIPEEDKIKLDFLGDFFDNFSLSEKNLFLTNFDSSFSNSKNCSGIFNCKLLFLKEEELEKTIKRAFNQIKKYQNTLVKKEDLDKHIEFYLKKITLKNKTSEEDDRHESIMDYLEKINKTNNPNYLQYVVQIISSITPQEIQRLLATYLDTTKASIVVNHAKGTTQEEISKNFKKANDTTIYFTSKYDSNTTPKQKIEEKISQIENYKLSNNIKAHFTNDSIYSPAILLIMKSPELTKASILETQLLTSLLRMGSIYNNPDYFVQNNENKDDLDDSDYFSNINLTEDTLFIKGQYQEDEKKSYSDLLNSLRKLISAPNFNEEDFKDIKDKLKEEIETKEEDIFDLDLANSIEEFKFLGLSKEEKLAQLDKITLDDIKNLWGRVLSNTTFDLNVSAPINKDQNYKTQTLNSLATYPLFKERVEKPIYHVNPQKTNLITTEKNGKKADVIMSFAYPETGNVEDEAKFKILNQILGQDSSSRLYKDLRGKQNLVYGAYSERIPHTSAEILSLSTNITTANDSENNEENILKVIESFKKNVELLKTQYVSQEELENAKNKIKVEILSEFNTPFQILDNATFSDTTPYGRQYHSKLIEAIDKITIEDIKQTANYVFKQQPTVLIKANKETLEKIKNRI